MQAKEVEKIYSLSNLNLEGKDVEDLSNKFNIVIDFIEDIFDVDTENIKMTESIDAHKAVFRKDEAKESSSRDDALKNAPDREFGYFRLDWNL
ncbi:MULTISPECIES: Asp-tRNA(Asn)/Glu-tRNA(Gln) amidotransferase subunit GatC [Anaerococcus]|jgi:aspartyl/glutamyl-tRNA(asn/gln) amidotransferase, C subunit|uniref:Asp-tRNA(Asn)/Glu-tRNA(Gln) amidotransferase GatCAB subunit C n=1 Tax=Anaerococcus octavius TaxID=54007 RepID=A0A2I1MA49_9FIRM|nr:MULTISPECIES: Asp-tRNA(Asn)/Glu-tRNA(Gln) amidotransferase subunit GatC [Anaerococcus]MBS6105661.1 Asp-tRNA(Asn)/Glu-tRNA(Gln) amidotransferase subunit GatC [Anaerococcus sp.]MDU2599175.1 Asp-tRNA(Asn)/Glu-tRNA(Gln) amidotransferase subunit GatC [Anaerococcus sp.]MDU3176368.1 Asp-tRNA(Asn)/Glu-tRNA(Gln) amidotransferase subunit GatC [Anaerococcus sp.]MDU4025329.1 Asp-tRNA(Asn)/Glu-tRNA(Gln) amidotransferase subunit GatC [Anaerococcus sp.]MDU5535359.1 Asp-tRNA(Asn)/Glu-tRNA(Gln) amidotransfe